MRADAPVICAEFHEQQMLAYLHLGRLSNHLLLGYNCYCGCMEHLWESL